MDKKKDIKTTDWLTRGMTKEELAQKKKAAIEEAERELKEKERDIGQEIYELACILYKNIEYNLGWHDCIYLADQAVKRGYRKQVEGEWTLKDHNLVCSLCEGEILEKTEYSRGCYMGAETVFSKYCPNCGAKMRNGE